MSDSADTPREPRRRPPDPAGTQPKVDPDSLLPRRPLPPPGAPEDVVEGEAVEEPAGELAEVGPASEGDLLPERRAAGGVGAVAASPPPPPHHARFHFVYGALAALGAAAVAVLVLVLVSGGGGSGSERAWSSWHPAHSAVAGASEIAGHVEGSYRSDGQQLVAVSASGMDFEGIPLTVAIRETAAQGGNIRIFDSGGFMYRLCGLGPQCSIPGQKSIGRHRLLRREALELALYSFRYLDADQVVVLMPPAPGQQPSQAVFFRRDDVAPELHRPLSRSLVPRTPSVQTIGLSPDAGLVDQLTLNRLFTFSLTQANTANRGFLVLDPITPTAAAADPPGGTQKQQKQGGAANKDKSSG